MSLRGDLVATIAALSTAAGTRVYQDELPQQADYPAIVVQMISNPGQLDLQGPEGFATARFQIDIWGDGLASKPTVGLIAAAINTAIHGFRGVMGSTTVYVARRENERDLSETDGDQQLRRIEMDFLITYLEA